MTIYFSIFYIKIEKCLLIGLCNIIMENIHNTETNSYCPCCLEKFSLSFKPFGVYQKCKHMAHMTNTCCRLTCLICKKTDPLVHKFRNDLLPKNSINDKSQDYTNILSVTRVKNNFNFFDRLRGFTRLFISLPHIATLLTRLYFNTIDKEYLHSLTKYLVWLLNINIKCSEESLLALLDKSYKRVVIANHTNYHDALVIGSLLTPTNNFGFIASHVINTNLFGKAVTKAIPNIIINDKEKNNYDRIAEYFNKYPSESRLLIFPEGMLTHTETIGKFRSTAFKLGYPVQPIVLKYKQNVFNLCNFDIWCFKRIDVEVKVLKPTTDTAENVRQLMAKEGDLKLSNVVNRKFT